jgi:hypothetical protein
MQWLNDVPNERNKYERYRSCIVVVYDGGMNRCYMLMGCTKLGAVLRFNNGGAFAIGYNRHKTY